MELAARGDPVVKSEATRLKTCFYSTVIGWNGAPQFPHLIVRLVFELGFL